MRIAPGEYLSLNLRAHEIMRGVPLYDVSAIDLPAGGSGRTVADVRALESTTRPSLLAVALFGVRFFLGKLFRWDRRTTPPEDLFLSRLSDGDRRNSEVVPGTRDGYFFILYQFPNESVRETINATVHGFVATVLVPREGGYRLYWAIYVIPVSWLTRPYLMLIEPFRRILYPAMLRRIRRAWIANYR